jgi:hypothetical protein
MSNERENGNLPATTYGDGWDEPDGDNRVVQGHFLKCVDGYWSSKTCEQLPARLLAFATKIVLQRWLDDKNVKVIDEKPLPDPERLNADVPAEE